MIYNFYFKILITMNEGCTLTPTHMNQEIKKFKYEKF